MLIKKKNKIKPLFKQLIKLRDNVQNRAKLLKFQRKKWENFKDQYLKKLRKYRKFKPKDYTKYKITRYANKGTSHKKQFRNTLHSSRKFRLFYGSLLKKELKKNIKVLKKTPNNRTSHINLLFLKIFEQRLDTVIFRAKFAKSFRDARQLINHKKIYVNNQIVKSPAYSLKKGDLITIDHTFHNNIIKNLKYCLKNWINYKTQLWPIPPKHLVINYTTMEIFFENIEITNFSTEFLFDLNLEKIVLNYYR
jgi:ribosomal protein S4